MKIIQDKNLSSIIMRDVRFFDGTEGLELSDEVRELLNNKLYRNFKEFNERLIKLSIRNALMSAQIKKFRAIH
jgi:chromosomal replication initiation ATPase DnaA